MLRKEAQHISTAGGSGKGSSTGDASMPGPLRQLTSALTKVRQLSLCQRVRSNGRLVVCLIIESKQLRVCGFTHTPARTHTRKRTHTHAHARTRMQTHAHAQILTCTRESTNTHAHARTCTHANARTRMQTHARTRTNTHTHSRMHAYQT